MQVDTDRAAGRAAAHAYTLPDLGYDHDALEPHLSAEIIELHHGRHHRAYVEGANAALDDIAAAREKGDFTRIATLERSLAFNVSGHVLHSILWQNLSPKGGGRPAGRLAAAIRSDFGSFDTFRQQMIAVAKSIMGSGWAALVWDPLAKRLATVQVHDHQSEWLPAATPLLVIDAWEHAWYLQYRTDKAKYLDAVWELFDWRDVAARLAAAEGVDLGIDDAH